MEAAQVPINRWLDEEDGVHLHSGILISHKKYQILSFVTTWMDLEGIVLSELSQTEKDKCHMILLPVESKRQANKKTETCSYIVA